MTTNSAAQIVRDGMHGASQWGTRFAAKAFPNPAQLSRGSHPHLQFGAAMLPSAPRLLRLVVKPCQR